MDKKQRLSLTLDDETRTALEQIMQHYGYRSNANAVRKAILDHAERIQMRPSALHSRRIY